MSSNFLSTGVNRQHHPHLFSPRTQPQPLSKPRTEAIIAVSEFCGTFAFLFMGMGAVQVANDVVHSPAEGHDASWVLFIATAFGVSLAANAWIFYRASGSMFNPAIVVGLLASGAIQPLRAAYVVVVQLLAGIVAAAVLHLLTPGPLKVATTLSGPTIAQGLFLEMFLTAQLMLAVLFLAVEKHKATYVAPLGIGAALFVGHAIGVPLTGASLNPARSFGPEVIVGFPGYAWIYWLGPCLGTLLAAGIYRLHKWLGYPLANPAQDLDDLELLAYQSASQPGVKDHNGGGVAPSGRSGDGPSRGGSGTADV